MHGTSEVQDSSTFAEYLAVVHRRRWLFLLVLVLVPLTAVLFSLRQERVYEASAEVLLSQENLAATLAGVESPSLNQPADRIVTTQAQLARVPTVVEATLRAARLSGRSVRDFLDATDVTPKVNSDLLDFRARDANPALAARLATEYARQFTRYRQTLDTAAVVDAREEIETRIEELEAAGDRKSPLYGSLLDKEQQLSTLAALQTSNASVVREASDAEQVQPKPVRNGILGLLLGLGLGVGLVCLWEVLDTRVRSAEEISGRLGLPLLARIPEPSRKLRDSSELVMRVEPHGVYAEAFRMLRTNLEFSRLDRKASTIMVTSAVEQEGKSTTVANLAVALARGGQDVVLVDLDLRRPYLHNLFDLSGAKGVTQVALGLSSLEDALVLVPITGSGTRRRAELPAVPLAAASGNGQRAPEEGSLRVLTSGPIPPDPGEFVATQRLDSILKELAGEADIVLVDAPPMLRVGDAMTLSARVDALVLVTRMNVVHKNMLQELRRMLEGMPAAKLGFVLTGERVGDAPGYGYGSEYEMRRQRKARPRRERKRKSAVV